MREKLLTFSIAAYNIEKYIDKLMNSLLVPEILDAIEILVVNDGSKDQTAVMAKQYEKIYPDTVRLIDKENGGHGSTINKGMELARGKYFRALDGDDWVNQEALVMLVKHLETLESDMLLMDYDQCFENGQVKRVSFPELINGREYSIEELAEKLNYWEYHTTIYKTELLRNNKICLQEHCFYVDREFLTFPIPYIQTVTYLAMPLYCYRLGTNEQSVSIQSFKKHYIDSTRVAENMLRFYRDLPNTVSTGKRKIILSSVSKRAVQHMGVILLFSPSKEKKQDLQNFDRWIAKHTADVYEAMKHEPKYAFFVIALRSANYRLYAPVAVFYQICRGLKAKLSGLK